MGAIIILNRRMVFGITSLVVFIIGFLLVSKMPIRKAAEGWVAFLILIGVSLVSAYFAARRFPPVGRRL